MPLMVSPIRVKVRVRVRLRVKIRVRVRVKTTRNPVPSLTGIPPQEGKAR